ncbi:MAG: MFS transporter [Candidatus Omnitrophica bacterium]|nr:MFS transporter [Candidatus Omnitrophota bacterium]MDD5690906.1 MFS transporter [Candidatus Omnitrophota bacterium]
MANQNKPHDFRDALKISDIRLFIGSVGFFTLASRALAVVIGFQIYKITHNPLSLGWLGLVEAIPAISIAPFGGYVADHVNRRTIILITRAVSCLCTLILAIISWETHLTSLLGLYAMIFLAGVARGFADPANTAFEAQVVPKHLTVNASSWISSTWISCSVIGPAAIGFIFDAWGAPGAYLIITSSFILSWIFTVIIPPKPMPHIEKRETVFKSISQGWNFVFKTQPLWTAMTLDLFSVFFGGAIILLPVYANDILHAGAKGLGLLNAAPSLGALIITLIATRHPPIERAGRNLLLSIAGFGVSIIIFAFSRNFLLSMSALFFSGVFDGISMVIRRSMVRLLSPDALRGRIASANWIFVCASNELGAFESGMLAAWIGTVPCVAVGGILTLGIVTLTAGFAKQLRNLHFDIHTLEQKKSTPPPFPY